MVFLRMATSILASGLCFVWPVHAQLIVPSPQPVSTQNEPRLDPLTDAAALYATYHSAVSDVQRRGFSSASDIDTSLRNLGGHNPRQLTEGWLAYSALITAQNDEFQGSVLDTESFYGREVFITGLSNDMRYARTLNGGNAAVLPALNALEADQRRLVNAATFVKEQAYSLQGSSWAMRRLPDSNATANNLTVSTRLGLPAHPDLRKAFSSHNLEPLLAHTGYSGISSIWEVITNATAAVRIPAPMADLASEKHVPTPQESIANRIATLAAYRIVGIDNSSISHMQRTMNERSAASCVTMANLNLQQCVAAAHKHYEVPFCIGEHALADIGKCFSQVRG